MAEPSFAALQSWAIFVFGTVLPIAFDQVGRWLHDWQGLATGFLALIAAWLWGNRILRAAQSEESVRKSSANSRARSARRGMATARSNLWTETTERSTPELSAELETLRRLIRSTLAGLPHTAISLTVDHQVQCERIAKFRFRDERFDSRTAERTHFENLLAQLSNLDVVRKEGNCRDIWEALTRINNSARALLDEIRRPDRSSKVGGD